MKTARDIFEPQYHAKSGPGSTLDVTEPYRRFLLDFISACSVRRILDLGCGDLTVMTEVLRDPSHDAIYTGVDCIPDLLARHQADRERLRDFPARFVCADVRDVEPDGADLVICKDVLQHWSNEDVDRWIDRLVASRFRFALITNCNYGPTVNQDIPTGKWRALDLTAEPFACGVRVFQWILPKYNPTDELHPVKDVVLIANGW